MFALSGDSVRFRFVAVALDSASVALSGGSAEEWGWLEGCRQYWGVNGASLGPIMVFMASFAPNMVFPASASPLHSAPSPLPAMLRMSFKGCFSMLLLTLLGFMGSVSALSCDATCGIIEGSAQVVCAVTIFAEPECSIAVVAAYGACVAGCGDRRKLLSQDSRRLLETNDTDMIQPHDASAWQEIAGYILGSMICERKGNGGPNRKDQERASRFCEFWYKKALAIN
eukprot:gene18659-25176_t